MLERTIELTKDEFSQEFFETVREFEQLVAFKEAIMKSLPYIQEYKKMDEIARTFVFKLLEVQLQETMRIAAMLEREKIATQGMS